MVNVSKKSLEKNFEGELMSQFSAVFSKRTKQEVSGLFCALLTHSEQIMLIKRLAGILLVNEQKLSTYEVAKRLQLSEATVRKIKVSHSQNQYDALIKICQKKSFNHVAFWHTVEVVLNGGLPPRTKDRWKHVRL